MKTIIRIAALGFIFTVGAAVSTYAQETCPPEKAAELYATWNKNKKSKIPAEIRLGIKAGEEFVAKCSVGQEQVAEHLKTNIPLRIAEAEKQERYTRFNAATADIKSLNADDAYTSGKGIIANEPDLAMDVSIALALVGFHNSVKTPPIDKYNAETINFAKKVISDFETGKTSKNYGFNAVARVVKVNGVVDPAKSKNLTIAWMNYVVGSIMYFNQKSEKDALPFFYKAAQIDSDVKTKPDIYQAIGGWYFSEIAKMEAKRQELIKANNNEDNDETLALLASMKGYAERGINAYSKAYKLASAPTQADYKKGLYAKLQLLYEVRFGKTEGLDPYIATAGNQPLVDPMTPVAPIVEAPTTTSATTTPTTGNTTKPTTGNTTKPATTTPANTKPATTTTPTKPATTTPTKPAAKTSGGKINKSKAAVNKKKGTK